MGDRLQDKVAIVTGGGSGIGASTCRAFAKEGAMVVAADVREDAAIAVAASIGSDKCITIGFDAADVSSVEQLVARTVEQFGRVDILHNNAGLVDPSILSSDTNPIDIDLELWDREFQVNVRGYLLGCRFVLPHMIANGGGSIIMTSSTASTRAAETLVGYTCSKAAVNGLVLHVATAYGKSGIRCNAVCPGLTIVDRNLTLPEHRLQIDENDVLTPRLGQPTDIAAVVTFLASDESSYLTGQLINVDGGSSSHLGYYGPTRLRAQEGLPYQKPGTTVFEGSKVD